MGLANNSTTDFSPPLDANHGDHVVASGRVGHLEQSRDNADVVGRDTVETLDRADMLSDEFDADTLRGFVESLRTVFPRADQVRWFELYLRGLITTPGRRSLEAVARSLRIQGVISSSAAAQSFQHFLSSSQWDEERLLSGIRAQFGARGEPESIWIVHDVEFPKRGRHSVGVHRQYVRSQGIKANSQTGVLISQLGATGYIPLAIRLYLPRPWLETATERQLAGIPIEDREAIGKPDLAVRLLKKLIDEGRSPNAVLAAEGFSSSHQFLEAVAQLGIPVTADSVTLQSAQLGWDFLKDHLGMDHFEGRSWRGWHHHAASVLTAYAFLFHHFPNRCPKVGNLLKSSPIKGT